MIKTHLESLRCRGLVISSQRKTVGLLSTPAEPYHRRVGIQVNGAPKDQP
jgi:hypothetical protein